MTANKKLELSLAMILICCLALLIAIACNGCTVTEKFPKKYTRNGATYRRFLKTHYYWTIDKDSTQTGTDWNYSPR